MSESVSTNSSSPSEDKYAGPYQGPLTQAVLAEIIQRKAYACLRGREPELQRLWRRGETRHIRAFAGQLYKNVKGLDKPRKPKKKPMWGVDRSDDPEKSRAVQLARRRTPPYVLESLGFTRDDLSPETRYALFLASIETLRRQLAAVTIKRGRLLPDNAARYSAAKELLVFLGARPVSHARRPSGPQRVEVQVAQFASARPQDENAETTDTSA